MPRFIYHTIPAIPSGISGWSPWSRSLLLCH